MFASSYFFMCNSIYFSSHIYGHISLLSEISSVLFIFLGLLCSPFRFASELFVKKNKLPMENSSKNKSFKQFNTVIIYWVISWATGNAYLPSVMAYCSSENFLRWQYAVCDLEEDMIVILCTDTKGLSCLVKARDKVVLMVQQQTRGLL